MKQWARWQDWAILVLGTWLYSSPWALEYSRSAARNAWMLGLFTVVAAAWLVAGAGTRVLQGTMALLGVCVFCAPWALGATEPTPDLAAWNNWLVGAGITVLAAWGYRRVPAVAHDAAR